ncbi:hypothetical protein AB0L25_38865 [Spirillospora sp. NPDC052242]
MSIIWETAFLTWANKGTGVAVAFTGALVVSPDGTRWFARRAWAKMTPWRRVRRQGSATLKAASTFTAVGHAVVTRSWADDTSVEERLNMLRQWITDVEHNIGRLKSDLAKHRRATDKALEELKTKHEAGLNELRSLIEQMEASDARIDGRALPVIGWGIVLSGVPELLAKAAWVTYPVCLLSAVVTAFVAMSVIRDYRRARSQAGSGSP